MRTVLIAAGIYNLVWGGWVILRPLDMFDWTGIPRPIYPSIWQCVGMVVGVYGVGYLVAARSPLRHWPIVLVGFLGKVFGPIGMLYQALAVAPGTPGRLPPAWLWLNVTNDVIWWIPFAAILYLAFKAWNAPSTVDDKAGLSVAEANERFRSQHGQSIAELSRQSPVLVVLLRHGGCTFCREALADLHDARERIEAAGTQIVLVHMGDNDRDATLFEGYGVADLHRISDPQSVLYRAYELPRGRIGQLFGTGVWWPGFRAAIMQRHGIGKLTGDGFQMPGVFLVRDNRIVAGYRHAHSAARPDYCGLAESANQSLSAV
jgi:hypothetical protein